MDLFKNLKNGLIKILVITALLILVSMQLNVLNFSQVFALEENVWKISESETDSVTATLDENGTLTISGKGNMLDWDYTRNTDWYEIANQVKKVVITKGVTNIGNYAFRYCSYLTDITIPDSVTSIGTEAFSSCSNLTNITIPDSVVTIGNKAFEYTGLTNIEVNTNNPNYSSESGVLFNKDKTKLIRYPEKKQDTTYAIPNNVKNISADAFYNCDNLVNLNIPSSVTDIAYYEFGNFYTCDNLESIEVDTNNPNYSSESGVLFNKDKKELIQYPKKKKDTAYVIPNGVTKIEEYAFSTCYNLTNVTIPTGVTSIGDEAFYGCFNLTNITIPNSVTSIGNDVFCACYRLTNLTIPEGVTSIGKGAFQHTNLTNIIIPNSINNMGSGVFYDSKIINLIKNNEMKITIPDFIKRIRDEQDFLYASDIELTNCSFDESEETILLDQEKMQANEWASIKINNGNCSGLIYYIGKNTWNISKDREDSVIATFDENGILNISGNGNMKDWEDRESQEGFKLLNYRIKEINILDGVTSVGNFAFAFGDDIDDSHNYEFDLATSLKITLSNDITSIGESAFSHCINLKDINLSNSITSIGNFAFGGCSNLTNITISEGVHDIGVDVFFGCGSLENIGVAVNNPSYSSDNGVLFDKGKTKLIQYPCGKKDVSYTIPNGVVNIEDWAFHSCRSLVNIKIPNTVTKIASHGFDQTFNTCTSLENIEVDEGNSNYSSQNGVLFNKEKTKLIQYPCEKKASGYEIPNTVTEIESNAFSGVRMLYITEENEISLEKLALIKRAKDPNDFLHANNIQLNNCSFSEDGKKLLLDQDKIQANEWAVIDIFDGELEGLSYYIGKNTWNISANSEESQMVGDIDGNEKVNISDLLLLKRHVIAGSKENWKLTGEKLKSADMNGDGNINISDILLLKRLVLRNM